MRKLDRSTLMQVTPDMILGITGHRPHKLGGYNDATNRCGQVKGVLATLFAQAKPACVVSGMALGVDQWAAEVALDLGIKVLALVPCVSQEQKWPPESQVKYRKLLDRIVEAGGEVEFVTKTTYTLTCMQLRNQRIVDYSSHMIAVWDGTWGGTGGCVRLAKQAGRKITVVHPTSLEVKEL